MNEEKARLETLDRILRANAVREQVSSIISRVRPALARKPEALMTWEPISLEVFGGQLPSEIRSSWVFVLRAGADTGAERHPNSHQRMMSWQGTGDLRTADPPTHKATAWQEAEIIWRSNILVSDPSAPLEKRWISILPNVWHRPVISNEADWVVISFHTVPASELIEERLNPGAAGGTTRMTYLDRE
jgi:hypothetical protein